MRNTRPLIEMIQLPAQIEQRALEDLQELCILKLDGALRGNNRSILPITDVVPLLNEISELDGHGEWWKLWLLKEGVLYCKESQQKYEITLNTNHEAVVPVQLKISIIIKSVQRLANERQETTQDALLAYLDNSPQFRGQPEHAANFCQLLRRSNVLQSITDRQGSRWRLNAMDGRVLAETADQYLPLLLVGTDHFLLREGFPYIHEHILAGKLANYVGYSSVQAIYHLALDKGMVQNRISSRTFRDSDKHMIEVRLVEEHEEVRKALRHRNLLILSLYNRGSRTGFTQDALWSELMKHMSRCFTLSRQTFNLWLSVFQRDGIVKCAPSNAQSEQELLHLNLDIPMVSHLLGRPNVLNLIKTMRIMGASYQSKPTQEIVDRMTKYITHDRQLATFALRYAQNARYVENSKQTNGEKTIESAKLIHCSFIRSLDSSNLRICTTLTQIVERMSQIFPQGRVPENRLFLEMEQESCFGITYEEYRYWINQSVHQHELLLEHRGERMQGYVTQSHYSVRLKVQEQK